jgi:peptidoglycan/xylan/chitin deacetylase (PgdA/CDA1 family)
MRLDSPRHGGRHRGRHLGRHLGWVAAALLASVTIWPAGLESQGSSEARRVAVTFDDVPANIFRGDLSTQQEITGRLLAAIERMDIPAIGFVNESKLVVEDTVDPERVKLLGAWIEAGMELGNHSYSHPDLHDTPLDAYKKDVLHGERVTRELLERVGQAPRFFRHPFLHTGRDLETKRAFERFLEEHGYQVAPVTIDNQEWIFARAYDHAHVQEDEGLKLRIAEAYVSYMDSIFGYYESQSKALLGYELPQVLLLHANRLNADVLDSLTGTIRARGYAFITLEEALRYVSAFVRDTFEDPPEY